MQFPCIQPPYFFLLTSKMQEYTFTSNLKIFLKNTDEDHNKYTYWGKRCLVPKYNFEVLSMNIFSYLMLCF